MIKLAGPDATRRSRSLVARLCVLSLALGLAAAVGLAAPTAASASTRGTVMRAVNTYARGSGFTLGISVLDTKTGTLYSAGDHRGTFASESVVKVFIATRLLVSGRMHGSTARRALYMIRRSDDSIASSLYGSVGGDSLITWIKRHYHEPDLGSPPRRSGWWGNTHITSDGLVRLYAKLKKDPKVSHWLLYAMHHATKYGSDGTYQFFGLPSATSKPAIKQGWGTDYDDWGRSSDFNTTGFVNGDRYAVAILARGPARFYGSKIGSVLTKAARLVLPGGAFPDPYPAMTSIAPTTGVASGRTLVTVHGHDFTQVRSVYFGNTRSPKVRVSSASTLVATAPRHAPGRVRISVHTAHGWVTRSSYTFVAPPTVTAVSPADGPTAGGTRVTVRGTSLTHVRQVLFGTTAGTAVTVASTTSLTVTAPAHDSGPVDVRVLTSYGTSRVVSADRFTYVAPPPTVTSVSPAQGATGGGTSVTVTGTGFTAASTVSFATSPASSVTYVSPTTLTAVAPAHAAGAVDVRVGTVWGTSAATSADQFTYLTPGQAQSSVAAPTATPDAQVAHSFDVAGRDSTYPDGARSPVDYFVYSYDDPTALTRFRGAYRFGGATASTVIGAAPVTAGAHTLYVATVDRLGNRSATTSYVFGG